MPSTAFRLGCWCWCVVGVGVGVCDAVVIKIVVVVLLLFSRLSMLLLRVEFGGCFFSSLFYFLFLIFISSFLGPTRYQYILLCFTILLSSFLICFSSPLPRQEHGELELRSDLLDCHVDVCSPEVLVQLSDNFDYQVKSLVYARPCCACFLSKRFRYFSVYDILVTLRTSNRS